MGSIYNEKWVFDGETHRTPEINETAKLIYHINRNLRHKKTGAKSLSDFHSGEVSEDMFSSIQFFEDLKVLASLMDTIKEIQELGAGKKISIKPYSRKKWK